MKTLLETYLKYELALNHRSIGNLTADQLAMFVTYDGLDKFNAVSRQWETFCSEHEINLKDVTDADEAEKIDAQYKFLWDNAHEVYEHTEDGTVLLGTVIDCR